MEKCLNRRFLNSRNFFLPTSFFVKTNFSSCSSNFSFLRFVAPASLPKHAPPRFFRHTFFGYISYSHMKKSGSILAIWCGSYGISSPSLRSSLRIGMDLGSGVIESSCFYFLSTLSDAGVGIASFSSILAKTSRCRMVFLSRYERCTMFCSMFSLTLFIIYRTSFIARCKG